MFITDLATFAHALYTLYIHCQYVLYSHCTLYSCCMPSLATEQASQLDCSPVGIRSRTYVQFNYTYVMTMKQGHVTHGGGNARSEVSSA